MHLSWSRPPSAGPAPPRQRSRLQEISQQLDPLEGQEALGVILDAFKRVGFVANTHDLTLIGPGNDLKLVGKGAGLDDQAVVSRRLERVGEVSVDAFAVVV